MRLTDFWWRPEWHAYEEACGQEPGTRAKLLLDATWPTRVLDLSQSEEVLWRGVRRSYHALVNKAEKDATLVVAQPVGTAFAVFGSQVHREAAGRQTRPSSTWVMQGQWIIDRLAWSFMAFRQVNGVMEPVAFIYVVATDGAAYYFSGASLEPNVSHLLQWHAIRQLRAAGIGYYELGWQREAQDEKGRHIEFFKRGWGGEDVDIAAEYAGLVQAIDV